MHWDVDELIAMARMGGHIKDGEWEDELSMMSIRAQTKRRLAEGYIPDLEYGRWVKPHEVNDGTT